MMNAGPALETLLRRLAETPADYRAEPRIGAAGQVVVAAVVNDLLLDFGAAPLNKARAAAFETRTARTNRNRLAAVLVGAWLLADPWFQAYGPDPEKVYDFLSMGLAALAENVPADQLTSDPERREELARLCLQAFDLRPAGESDIQAHDRLAALNTADRQRVIAAVQAAEQRAREIREALARQAAEEAADKWTRE